MQRLIGLVGAAVLGMGGLVQAGNPVEIGDVRWGDDLDAALAESRESGKPVFLLFQEVPGCAGCQEFGQTVLREPLLVEAIEDEFVPVVVYNNKDGKDKVILERFGEPAWNYQVVRFLDGDAQDLIPRKDKVWTTGPLATRMIAALEAAGRDVPLYVETLVADHSVEQMEQAAFAMHCYWVGEVELGKLDGVATTEAGWLEGKEVTLVTYDPQRVSLDALSRHAKATKCGDKVYTESGARVSGLPSGKLDPSYRVAKDSDQKKQIEAWAFLEDVPSLNDAQRTKINAYAPSGKKAALSWLSPRQRAAVEGQGS